MTHLRHEQLPQFYADRGRRAPVRIEFPKRGDRQKGKRRARQHRVPTYLPTISWAFGIETCQQYERLWHLGPLSAIAADRHPLDPIVGSEDDYIPASGCLLRKCDRNLLVLSTVPGVDLTPNVVSTLIDILPTAGCGLPARLAVQPRFLDCSILSLETVLLTGDDVGLTVVPKQGEDLYLAWLCARAARSQYPQAAVSDLFFRIPPADLRDAVSAPAPSFPADDVLLVDDTNAGKTRVAYAHVSAELRPAFDAKARTQTERDRAKALTDAVVKRLGGHVDRIGASALGRALSSGATPTQDMGVNERWEFKLFKDGRCVSCHWDRATRMIKTVEIRRGKRAFSRITKTAAALKKIV